MGNMSKHTALRFSNFIVTVRKQDYSCGQRREAELTIVPPLWSCGTITLLLLVLSLAGAQAQQPEADAIKRFWGRQGVNVGGVIASTLAYSDVIRARLATIRKVRAAVKNCDRAAYDTASAEWMAIWKASMNAYVGKTNELALEIAKIEEGTPDHGGFTEQGVVTVPLSEREKALKPLRTHRRAINKVVAKLMHLKTVRTYPEPCGAETPGSSGERQEEPRMTDICAYATAGPAPGWANLRAACYGLWEVYFCSLFSTPARLVRCRQTLNTAKKAAAGPGSTLWDFCSVVPEAQRQPCYQHGKTVEQLCTQYQLVPEYDDDRAACKAAAKAIPVNARLESDNE